MGGCYIGGFRGDSGGIGGDGGGDVSSCNDVGGNVG